MNIHVVHLGLNAGLSGIVYAIRRGLYVMQWQIYKPRSLERTRAKKALCEIKGAVWYIAPMVIFNLQFNNCPISCSHTLPPSMLIFCSAFQCSTEALNWSHLFQLTTGTDLSTVSPHGVSNKSLQEPLRNHKCLRSLKSAVHEKHVVVFFIL